MSDKTNILKQAKHDIFIALEGIIKSYNMRGASYSALKKYYKKNKNFDEILDDIKNKSINLFDKESEYKKFVKEVLMDILDDRIAHEKDKKKLKKFESYKENEGKIPINDFVICHINEICELSNELNDFFSRNIGKLIEIDYDTTIMPFLVKFEKNIPKNMIEETGLKDEIWMYREDISHHSPNKEKLTILMSTKKYNL